MISPAKRPNTAGIYQTGFYNRWPLNRDDSGCNPFCRGLLSPGIPNRTCPRVFLLSRVGESEQRPDLRLAAGECHR